jgi:hypothetical protein
VESTLTHPNLKQVMLGGECLLDAFALVAIPSLRFISLDCQPLKALDVVNDSLNSLQQLFDRSGLRHGIQVSIHGVVSPPFISSLIQILPPRSCVYLPFSDTWIPDSSYARAGREIPLLSSADHSIIRISASEVDEIVHTKRTGSHSWLGGGHRRSSLRNIQVPTSFREEQPVSEE